MVVVGGDGCERKMGGSRPGSNKVVQFRRDGIATDMSRLVVHLVDQSVFYSASPARQDRRSFVDDHLCRQRMTQKYSMLML